MVHGFVSSQSRTAGSARSFRVDRTGIRCFPDFQSRHAPPVAIQAPAYAMKEILRDNFTGGIAFTESRESVKISVIEFGEFLAQGTLDFPQIDTDAPVVEVLGLDMDAHDPIVAVPARAIPLITDQMVGC